MKEMQIRIHEGQIRFIYDDDLTALMEGQGQTTTKRASHVEPCDGGWLADMSPVHGPVLGPFARRDEALAEEVKWLNKNKIPIPSC